MRIEKCDVLVVGGGIMGLVAAKAHARRGCSVLVLEAGSQRPVGDWRALEWYSEGRDFTEVVSAYDYNEKLSWVKALGGGTEAWEGYTPRWVESDFKLHSEFGVAEDWPYGYGELERFYCQAEEFLGVAGVPDNPYDEPRTQPYPLPAFEYGPYEREVLQRTRPLDLSWHHVPQCRNSRAYAGRSYCTGVGRCNSCPVHARWSPSATLIPSIRNMPNVRIVSDSVCLKLSVDRDNWITHVDIGATTTGEKWRLDCQHVVLAAGAVESARLLLLSRSAANPQGLCNGHGLVGTGFMDHPVQRVRAEVPWDFSSQTQTNMLASSHTHRKYDPHDNTWGFLVNLNSRSWPSLWIAAHMEMPPEKDNRVTLSKDHRDDFGRPTARLEINAGWQGFDATLEKIKRVLLQIVHVCGGRDPSFDGFQMWACHPMGGLKLGANSANSIVNPDLRSWEVPNLDILGAGVLPTGAAVNPTLTLLAMALRYSEQQGKRERAG